MYKGYAQELTLEISIGPKQEKAKIKEKKGSYTEYKFPRERTSQQKTPTKQEGKLIQISSRKLLTK